MPITPAQITPLPPAPSRDDSVNFAVRADTFVAALPGFGTQSNTLAANVYTNALESAQTATASAASATAAAASQLAAETSATASAASANTAAWVSGATYAAGATVYSPINFLTYRRTSSSPGSSTTDPSADIVRWTQISVNIQVAVGSAPNNVPLNQYLGSMAYQDAAALNVGAITSTGNSAFNGDVAIQGAVTVNDAGADVDFRIEGDTNANLFFVDASLDHVAIGQVPDADRRFSVRGKDATSSNFAFSAQNNASPPEQLLLVRNDGLIITGTSATSPYNNTTANAANMVVSVTGDLQRSTSSLRYKTDIQTAEHGLVEVLKLRSVTYKGKNDGDKVLGGLIAEEVHEAGLTEFVVYDAEGRPDALHYGNMVALLVKAVQELTQRVKLLEGDAT
jgi:hypothetical protein